MTRIVAYQVQNDGNWDPVTFSKDKLKPEEVYIFVDDEKKALWIWIGQEANVRTRFISSTVAQELRRMYGLTFRVRSADQGTEPMEFWECIESLSKEKMTFKTPKNFTSAPIPPSNVPPNKDKVVPNQKIKKSIKRSSKRKLDSETKKPARRAILGTKTLNDYIKEEKTPITTPLCPQCLKGNLLPYSQIIDVTTRKKEILPFAKWVCSFCKYSPSDSKADYINIKKK